MRIGIIPSSNKLASSALLTNLYRHTTYRLTLLLIALPVECMYISGSDFCHHNFTQIVNYKMKFKVIESPHGSFPALPHAIKRFIPWNENIVST
jgi:hypothetical protein